MNTETREIEHAVTTQMRFIIQQMVSGFAGVTQAVDASGKVSILVEASKANYGIINGRHSRMLKALRFIAEQAGKRTGCQCELKLDEKSRHNIPPPSPFVQNAEVDEQRLILLLKSMVGLLIGQPAADSIEHSRNVDKIEALVKIDRNDPWQVGAIVALAEVFYAIGMKNGVVMIVKKRKSNLVAQ